MEQIGDFIRDIRKTSREVLESGIPYETEPPAAGVCPFCGKTLYHEGLIASGRVVFWNPKLQLCDCAEAAKRHEKELERKKEEQHREYVRQLRQAEKNRIAKKLDDAGIKKKFLKNSFSTFQDVTEEQTLLMHFAMEYTKHFDEHAKTGKGLYICGGNGIGKTHIAVATAKAVLKKDYSVIFKTSIGLMEEIKKRFKASDDSEYEVIQAYKDADLLVIDDIGQEQQTEWSVSILFSIINDRYENEKPVVFTSNYTPDELKKAMTLKNENDKTARAIISRIKGMCDVKKFGGEDYRRAELGISKI